MAAKRSPAIARDAELFAKVKAGPTMPALEFLEAAMNSAKMAYAAGVIRTLADEHSTPPGTPGWRSDEIEAWAGAWSALQRLAPIVGVFDLSMPDLMRQAAPLVAAAKRLDS